MSPLTSTQTYVFAGEMQLGEELIDIALEFQGHSVRLSHADTVIGSWPRSETEFARVSSDHYRVTAEGDSISFHPYDATEFGRFLAGEPPHDTAEDSSEDPEGPATSLLGGAEHEDSHGNGAPAGSDHPDWATQVPLWESLDKQPAPDETSAGVFEGGGLTSPEAVHGPNPARPAYPPTEPQPVRFSSPPPPTPVTDHAAHHPWQDPRRPPEHPESTESVTQHPVIGSPSTEAASPPVSITERTNDSEPAQPAPAPATEPEPTQTTPPETSPPTTEPQSPPAPPAPGPQSPPPAPAPEPILDRPEIDTAPDDVTPSQPSTEVASDRVSPNQPEPADSINGDSITGAASNLLDLIRTRVTSIRSAVGQKVTTPPAAEPNADAEDEPTPFDDAENLRQWAMVSVVGLAMAGLLVALTWGVLSLFGGGNEASPATTTIPTTTSSVANAFDRTPATVAVPPDASSDTTVAQDQPSFVEQWNRLATAYAYNLAIDVDSEPISTAVTSNIHLSFDQDRVLTLDMTPVGNGSDRDILVAMGMAVAWAEPDLSPAARKDLLGSLGIDIDSPKLADIGGELTRSGHTYRASVIDGIIRFQISPAE